MPHINYPSWDIENKIKYLSWIPQDVKTILDIGCGRGEFLSLAASKYQVHGCDNDPECIQLSLKFGEVKLVDALDLRSHYEINSFDLVTAFHILEHIICPLEVLRRIFEVTNKYILIAVPNARYIASKELDTHLYSWNTYTLQNILKKAGFQVMKISGDHINIFPRWLRLGPIVNRILLKVITAPNELIVLGKKR